jgi:hypothetical protein
MRVRAIARDRADVAPQIDATHARGPNAERRSSFLAP